MCKNCLNNEQNKINGKVKKEDHVSWFCILHAKVTQ